jgi:uncharacterized protein YifN (PemK superfamily)
MLVGFMPSPGDVLMCDFSGYAAPEIVKKRRTIVISPRRSGQKLCLVVPVSTTPPKELRAVHVLIPAESYSCFGDKDVWVKADLIAHVRFDRLDRVRVGGRYIPTTRISKRHFAQVQCAVLHALGLGKLASYI